MVARLIRIAVFIAFFQDKKNNEICFETFRNFSSAEPYSSNIESTNTDGSFHVNKTRRNNARKEVLLHDDLKGLSSSPGLIEFNRKNKRETSGNITSCVHLHLYLDKHR